MKNQFTSRIVKLTFAFLFILIASSCSQDDEAMDAAVSANEINSEIAAKGGKVTASVAASTLVESLGDCNIDCIDENSGDEFADTYSGTVQWGGRYGTDNSKTFNVNVWNTLTTIEYEFTCDELGGSNLQYYDESSANWVSAGQFTSTNAGIITISRNLPEGWKACDVITEQWRQVGSGADIELGDVSYSLIGECTQCDESFSYAANEDGSYTFTYVSEVRLNAAEVKFTSPHITGFTAGDGKTYNVNLGNKNGSPTVLTWTGDIAACTPITYILSFDADCEQNEAGFANLWNDFKVNGDSKKGFNKNIKYDCN